MSKLNTVSRNAFAAIAQVLVSGLVLFLLYKFLIKVIGTDQIGVWSIVLAAGTAAQISELGLSGSSVKYVAAANARGDSTKASDVVQTSFLTILTFLGLVLILAYPLFEKAIVFFLPENSHDIAKLILPYALFSVWISSSASAIYSSLDGCHRIDLRAYIVMAGGIFFLILVFILTPLYGLLGLSISHLAQSIFILCTSWILLKKQMPLLPAIPYRWNYATLKEMISYGANFQIITLVTMLYEPLTKALIAKFGGLSATAYYEMANRMIRQFRSLIVSANQALVPKIAVDKEINPKNLERTYQESYRLIFFLSVPLYSIVIIISPLIGYLWIGTEELYFLIFSSLIAVGFLINTISAPAYFMNIGTGKLKWNVISHIFIGILTAIFGTLFGLYFGATGVVIGSISALIISSIINMLGYCYENSSSIKILLPTESWRNLVISFSCIIFSWIILPITSDSGSLKIENVIYTLSLSLIIIVSSWLDPTRKILLNKIRFPRKFK